MKYIIQLQEMRGKKKPEAKMCDTETNLHKFEVVGDQNIAFVSRTKYNI